MTSIGEGSYKLPKIYKHALVLVLVKSDDSIQASVETKNALPLQLLSTSSYGNSV